jgi:hypothetical protein
MLIYKSCCLLPLLLLSWSLGSNAFTHRASFVTTTRYNNNGNRLQQRQQQQPQTIRFATEEKQQAEAASSPTPVLNGKRILPYKILMAGLKGHKVAGAYALLNKEYKRG